MSLPGETICTGAPRTCPECGETPAFEVFCRGKDNCYVGTMCKCGPYSRESDYMTFDDAEHLARVLNKLDGGCAFLSFLYLVGRGFDLRGIY